MVKKENVKVSFDIDEIKPENEMEEWIIWLSKNDIINKVPYEPCEIKELQDYGEEALNTLLIKIKDAIKVVK